MRLRSIIVGANARTEGDSVVEHRAEVRDHDRRCRGLEHLAVHRESNANELPAQHSPQRRPRGGNGVGEYTQTTLQPGRRFGDHRGIDADPSRYSEVASGLERVHAPKVDSQQFPAEEHRHRPARVEWNAERAREQIASSPRQDAEGRGRGERQFGERARRLHSCSVTTERENGVVMRGPFTHDLLGVAWPLSQDDVAADAPPLEGCASGRHPPPSEAGCGIRDEQRALDRMTRRSGRWLGRSQKCQVRRRERPHWRGVDTTLPNDTPLRPPQYSAVVGGSVPA